MIIFLSVLIVVKAKPDDIPSIEKCCQLEEVFDETFDCKPRYVHQISFLICINYFYSSEKDFIPEIKENPNIAVSFQHNFWQDFHNKHPRLNNCLDIFALEDDEKWFIMKDGSLNHVNHSITKEYCIEVLKVKLYIYVLSFNYSGFRMTIMKLKLLC